MREKLTRRRVLLGTGTAAAGTLGGITLSSSKASATVNGQFSIPNGTTTLADSQLRDVRMQVSTEWTYSANAPMSGLELELYVGETIDTADLIARHTREDLGKESLTGETELNGSLMSSSDFAIEDFQPSNGELRRTVVAELRLYVLRRGEVAAEARHQTTFDVVVRNEELQVETTLTATGDVSFTTSTPSD